MLTTVDIWLKSLLKISCTPYIFQKQIIIVMIAIYSSKNLPYELYVLEVEEASPEAFWEAWRSSGDSYGDRYPLPTTGEVVFVEGMCVDHMDV